MKLDNKQILKLTKKSEEIRKDLIKICVKNGAGHIAPSLSTVEILVSLYYNVMKVSNNPLWEKRDRLIFSKAHGGYALYSILSDIGFIKKSEWENFYIESPLMGCIERDLDRGLEAGCGALGHGFPMAVGLAYAAKQLKQDYKVFCIIGDGEMQEGTTWESLIFAVKHSLDNLTLIIDNNKLQALDFVINVLDNKADDLISRLKGFKANVFECDGHSFQELNEMLTKKCDNIKVIVANTVKGKGMKCMENVPMFHFRLPNSQELEKEKLWQNR